MGKTKREPCDFCTGHLHPRFVTVVRGRVPKRIVIENVPAMVCHRCGMRYYDAPVVRGMEALLKNGRKFPRRTIRIPVTRLKVVA